MFSPALPSSSPSSPRRRQFGFVPTSDAAPTQSSTIKSEMNDSGGMEGIWAELDAELDQGEEAMDYDDLMHDNGEERPFAGLSMPSPAPIAAASSSSHKTTSESASGSSAYTSPSLHLQSDSPSSAKEGMTSLQTPGTSVHSNDSIAQMLEYMRACNNQDQASLNEANASEARDGGRKKERNMSRNARTRKQRSPIQKLARSTSHGGGVGGVEGSKRRQAGCAMGSTQSRQRTSIGSPTEVLQIDTVGAVRAHPSNEPWTASESPLSTRSLSQSWQKEDTPSPPAAKNAEQAGSNGDSLSLMDFLKRPEGAAWVEHFRTTQPPPRMATTTAAIPNHPVSASMPSAMAPTPTAIPQMPSFYPALPRQIDVATVLGMQQTPNSALIAAFQTAFVLGLQQLGIGNHCQPAGSSGGGRSIRMNQSDHLPYFFPWAAQQPASATATPGPTFSDTVPQPTAPGDGADGGAAVLQSLLHDINQQRPDQEDFSLDDFLAFVANTIEHSGDDEAVAVAEDSDMEQRPTAVASSQVRKAAVALSADEADPEKKRNRRRTISISGQLNGTHLDDVTEDIGGEGKDDDGEGRRGEGEMTAHRVQSGSGSQGEGERQEREHEESDEESEEERDCKVPLTQSSRSKGGRVVEKEASKLAERRRRRRESHNAVERRRRDHINERIAELASLLPESMLLDAIASSTAGGTTPHIDLSLFARKPSDGHDAQSPHDGNQTELERKAVALAPVSSSSETLALAQSKPNKGIILSKSVDYIKHLHEFCSALRTKNKEMQQELDRMKDAVMLAGVSASSYHGRSEDVARHPDTSVMTNATPPPNLATWWSQYREKAASREAMAGDGAPATAR